MPPAFSDSTSAPAPSPAWKSRDHPVARGPRQAAVVALDRRAGDASVRCSASLHAPLGEVGEHQHALAGGEHRFDDLLEPGELARAPGERPVVVLVRGGVVADLLERGDRGEDLALARLLALGQVGRDARACRAPPGTGRSARGSSRSGRARRSGRAARPRSPAPAFVRRNTRMPLSARSASSARVRRCRLRRRPRAAR